MNATIDYDASTREGRDALRSEIRLSWDGHDPWGSALSPAFDLCELLYWNGEAVPAEAEFQPGAIQPAFDDYPAEMFRDMWADGTVTTGDLYYWARVLVRFTEIVPEDQKY